MAKVLVTGGMGLLGSRLVPVLSARYHDVRVLSRHASPERVPSNVQAVVGFPLFPSTHRMVFQPIDAGEVSERLAELIERGPSGRVTDLGGPEVLTVRQLCDARYDIHQSSNETAVGSPARVPARL
ncbi:hypothetical protein BH20ACT1_BH20ACT1_11120 [soil metagenome]